MPSVLAALDLDRSGLPSLPTMPLVLHTAEAALPVAVARLAMILRETITEQTAHARRRADEPSRDTTIVCDTLR
jgi:hypothetical protein